MKIFKKIFGIKPKKISKYESNTLAEFNESPDLRTVKDAEEEKTPTTESKREKASAKSVAPIDAAKAKDAAKSDDTPQKRTTAAVKKSVTASNDKVEKIARKEVVSDVANPSAASKSSGKKSVAAKNNSNSSKQKLTNAEENKTSAPTDESESEPTPEPTLNEKASISESGKSGKSGKFEIKKSKDGRYVFNLYASNNVIVATSQVYSSSTAAMNGIKSVIVNSPTAPIEDQTLKSVVPVPFPKWEIYRDKSEHYRFRLCASNGSCVCHSQGYTSKTNCKKGIESIIKSAPGAEIVKAYLNKDK